MARPLHPASGADNAAKRPEVREKIRQALKTRHWSKLGTYHPQQGIPRTEDVKAKISKAKVGTLSARKGVSWDQEYGPERAAQMRTELASKMRSSSRLREFHWKTLGLQIWNKGKKMTPAYCKRDSDALRRKIAEDPDYLKRCLTSRRPTSLETAFQSLVDGLHLPFRYTGNGALWIGFPPLNPDFVHTSLALAIEVNGDYWHPREKTSQRIAAYKRHGWTCLVLWEKELDNAERVVQLLRRKGVIA